MLGGGLILNKPIAAPTSPNKNVEATHQ